MFGAVVPQHIMEGAHRRAGPFISQLGVKERESGRARKDLRTPSKGTPPYDQISTRPHLLKCPLPSSSTAAWGLGL